MKKTDNKAKGRLKGPSLFANVGIAETHPKGGGRWPTRRSRRFMRPAVGPPVSSRLAIRRIEDGEWRSVI